MLLCLIWTPKFHAFKAWIQSPATRHVYILEVGPYGRSSDHWGHDLTRNCGTLLVLFITCISHYCHLLRLPEVHRTLDYNLQNNELSNLFIFMLSQLFCYCDKKLTNTLAISQCKYKLKWSQWGNYFLNKIISIY